jgi:hypothetical protein
MEIAAIIESRDLIFPSFFVVKTSKKGAYDGIHIANIGVSLS